MKLYTTEGGVRMRRGRKQNDANKNSTQIALTTAKKINTTDSPTSNTAFNAPSDSMHQTFP